MNPFTEGYKTKQFDIPTKRIVQTMSLRNDPQLIAEYKKLHSRPHMWREIIDGIRHAGILEMEIYIDRCTLVMIVEVPCDFDWDKSMAYLSTLPRQQEWENTVAAFQKAIEGQTSAEKWKPMERMFHLY